MLSRYLTPFVSYNLLLVFVFSAAVNEIYHFKIINIIFYVILHYLIIYIGIYYYRNSLYLLFFLYGLFLDLMWINQIGPHLSIFMFLLLFFNYIKKFLYNLNSIKIYILILSMVLIVIFFEMLISQLIYDYVISISSFSKLSVIAIVISIPILYIFSKIDDL